MLLLLFFHFQSCLSIVQNTEGSFGEDFGLFLEGSSCKHEQAEFSGILFTSLSHDIWIHCSQIFNLKHFWQVNVRSFGHRNPLEEYKIDGCRFFISMLSATRRLTVESLLKHWSSPMESQELYI